MGRSGTLLVGAAFVTVGGIPVDSTAIGAGAAQDGNNHRERAMKRFVVVLALTLAATAASAQSRPSTVNRPCAASQQLVLSRGAIVLGTGGHTYDRFVRDAGFCEFNEYTSPAYVPSADTPQCFVGYRCKAGPREWFWDD